MNRLGYFRSCEQNFRPDTSKNSLNTVASDDSYKKYYLAKMIQLFKILKQGYVGFCVPEFCTADDIKLVIKEIIGEQNYAALIVTDTHQYAKENLKWDIGTFAWFGIIVGTAAFAGIATYRNQKLVKAKKDEKDRQKELGQSHTVNERRKE